MKELISHPPCKINLGLNIISKREDGYHNIETIFYPLRLTDHLIIKKSDEFLFSVNDLELSREPEKNLVVKAVRALESVIGRKIRVEIRLNKIIPMGAGLGGGSSDAAYTLAGVVRLLHLPVQENDLREIALSLGSDVPFFLNPVVSFAEGRGERLTPIENKTWRIQKPLLLVNPLIHISTAWAYQNCAPAAPKVSLRDFPIWEHTDYSRLRGIVTNDFESAVERHYPEIAELKQILFGYGAEFVLMSGSGSSLFSIFPTTDSAENARRFLQYRYFTYLEQ